MLNATEPPFDDIRMRQALAMGSDRDDINEIVNDGLPTVANGPFAPGGIGYLKDTGLPEVRPRRGQEARRRVRGGRGKAPTSR